MVDPLSATALGLQTAAGVGSFVSGVVGSRRRRQRLARIARGDDPVVAALRNSAASQATRTAFAAAQGSGANPAQALREGQATVLQLGQQAEDRIAPIQAERQEAAQQELENRRQQRLQQGLSGASLLLNTAGTGMAIRGAQNAQQGSQKPVDKSADIAAFQAQQAGQAAPQAQTAAPTGPNPETDTPFATFADFVAPSPRGAGGNAANFPELDGALGVNTQLQFAPGAPETLLPNNGQLFQSGLTPRPGMNPTLSSASQVLAPPLAEPPMDPETMILDSLEQAGLDESAQAAFMEMMSPEDVTEYFNLLLAGDQERANLILENFLMFYEPAADVAQLQAQANMIPGGEFINGVLGDQSVFNGILSGAGNIIPTQGLRDRLGR